MKTQPWNNMLFCFVNRGRTRSTSTFVVQQLDFVHYQVFHANDKHSLGISGIPTN